MLFAAVFLPVGFWFRDSPDAGLRVGCAQTSSAQMTRTVFHGHSRFLPQLPQARHGFGKHDWEENPLPQLRRDFPGDFRWRHRSVSEKGSAEASGAAGARGPRRFAALMEDHEHRRAESLSGLATDMGRNM
jgi:hypothetical protein